MPSRLRTCFRSADKTQLNARRVTNYTVMLTRPLSADTVMLAPLDGPCLPPGPHPELHTNAKAACASTANHRPSLPITALACPAPFKRSLFRLPSSPSCPSQLLLLTEPRRSQHLLNVPEARPLIRHRLGLVRRGDGHHAARGARHALDGVREGPAERAGGHGGGPTGETGVFSLWRFYGGFFMEVILRRLLWITSGAGGQGFRRHASAGSDRGMVSRIVGRGEARGSVKTELDMASTHSRAGTAWQQRVAEEGVHIRWQSATRWGGCLAGSEDPEPGQGRTWPNRRGGRAADTLGLPRLSLMRAALRHRTPLHGTARHSTARHGAARRCTRHPLEVLDCGAQDLLTALLALLVRDAHDVAHEGAVALGVRQLVGVNVAHGADDGLRMGGGGGEGGDGFRLLISSRCSGGGEAGGGQGEQGAREAAREGLTRRVERPAPGWAMGLARSTGGSLADERSLREVQGRREWKMVERRAKGRTERTARALNPRRLVSTCSVASRQSSKSCRCTADRVRCNHRPIHAETQKVNTSGLYGCCTAVVLRTLVRSSLLSSSERRYSAEPSYVVSVSARLGSLAVRHGKQVRRSPVKGTTRERSVVARRISWNSLERSRGLCPATPIIDA